MEKEEIIHFVVIILCIGEPKDMIRDNWDA